MKSVVELLQDAKARIERGWCQCTQAKDARGWDVDPKEAKATAWCLSGAIMSVAPKEQHSSLVSALIPQLPPGEVYLSSWNDRYGRTQAEVVELFERAIAAQTP